MTGCCKNETVLLQQVKGNCKAAFEEIVRKYMKQAYHIALGFVGNKEDAMDLSQEAFYRAYKNINTLDCDRKFFPWFYQILKNLCFTHLRKQSNRLRCQLDGVVEETAQHEYGLKFNPELIAEKNENKVRVWQALGQLDEKHREIIVLRHFQNLSYKQIAEALYCSKDTVTTRLYHARRMLKQILNRKEVDVK
ncbi:MAG: sigma-70 family RNA polymerase sigma factor [Sedimentisphaerales bacterium]|nr:sigma-70 family RNA polymerase sigma factor [Sedimentisphaerales bacterium]